MAKRQLSNGQDLPPTFSLREVQATARPRATAGTITVTISSSLTDAPPEYERLVKRAKGDMGEEGPSGNGKVLPQYPLEYKKDEEESEGEAYLLDQEEEGMEEWLGQYPCDLCGRMATYSQNSYIHPYCSVFCSDRAWDAMQQERDDHYDWYCNSYPEGSSLSAFFQDQCA